MENMLWPQLELHWQERKPREGNGAQENCPGQPAHERRDVSNSKSKATQCKTKTIRGVRTQWKTTTGNTKQRAARMNKGRPRED